MEELFPTLVTLRSLVRVPRKEPGAPLVIALHGWGMTARAFVRWLRPGIDHRPLSWWVPRAMLPGEVSRRRIGYSWYVFDGDQEALRESMDEARAYLVGLAETARRALRPGRIALMGFSQGAYLASYTALTRPDLFQALVCCCGRPKTEFVDDLAAARDLRVLVQTGSRDTSVRPELIVKGVRPLREHGIEVTETSHDTDHRLIPEMVRGAAEFLA